MTVFQAFILGLAQGLCEFLPVSSSGHLVLLQNIFGISEGALFFDSMLHLGTLIAVVAVFAGQLWGLIKKPLQKRVYMLLAATAVTAVMALLFKDFFSDAYAGGLLGVGFLITSLVLLLSDRLAHGKKRVEDMKVYEAAGIGFMQGIAILPGISRSGSTIAGARLFGLSKAEAADFSFILSIPPILGSLLLQLKDVAATGTGDASWLCVAVGAVTAAVSGYFAIRFMLRLIREKRLIGFSIYTGVLGILVLLDQTVFNVFFANPFI